jgi:hypothetical protein
MRRLMSATDDTTEPVRRSRLRFELIFASAWIGFGLLALPALIYWVGELLLGPYGEDAGLGTFYLDYFAALAEPSGRAWALLLGPLATISLLRLIFRNRAKPSAEAVREEPPPRAAPRRVEPRLGSD